MTLRIEVTEAASAASIEAIGSGLAGFNAQAVGASDRRLLAVLLRGDDGAAVHGGLHGYTGWGWLYTQWLWLPEALRGRGLAARLLDAAEAEARARGCHGAWIDTFNPAALRVYERQGYAPFGVLPDFPKGHRRTFLCKVL